MQRNPVEELQLWLIQREVGRLSVMKRFSGSREIRLDSAMEGSKLGGRTASAPCLMSFALEIRWRYVAFGTMFRFLLDVMGMSVALWQMVVLKQPSLGLLPEFESQLFPSDNHHL